MNNVVRGLERFIRHAVVYPLFRLLLHNPIKPLPVDGRAIRKILILRYDRIGDIIVTTPIFRLLKKRYPHLRLAVFASPANAEIVRGSPYVDQIYVLERNWFRLAAEIKRAHDERFDLILNFIFNRTTSGGILANVISPQGTKIGQGDEKYRFYFNILMHLDRGSKHMAEVLGDIVKKVFDIPVNRRDLRMELTPDMRSRQKVRNYIDAKERSGFLRRRKGRRYVVVNISATDEARKISERQAISIVRILSTELSVNTVVVASPADRELRRRVVSSNHDGRCWSFPDSGDADIMDVAAIIQEAAAVVTPDTSIIHFASALKTPVLGFFTPLQVAAEWLPFQVPHKIVLADNGQPVSSIPEAKLKKEIVAFMKPILRKSKREREFVKE